MIDLFAGCGGLTRGFMDAGPFLPIMAVEVDADAAKTYELNFGPHIERNDDGTPARLEDVASYPKADVVVGGPPCQGFSPLNMRGVGLERRGLWREYVKALTQANPRVFVMENVPELLKSAEYLAFKSEAQLLGYTVEGRILNAANYGVPQTRKRAIAIGIRGGLPIWPGQTHYGPGQAAPENAEPWQTFRDAMRGLPLRPTGRSWHNARNPKPISLERYQCIPSEGEGRFELAERRPDITPQCWLRKKTGSTDVFGRLWWDRPAFTIRTEFYKPEKGRYLHPSEHRPITVREAARCQTFPDDFVFPETQSMTSVAKQIGNAVPPRLAECLASVVLEMLAETPGGIRRGLQRLAI